MSESRSKGAVLNNGILGQMSGSEKRLGLVITNKGVIYQKKYKSK